MKAIYQCENCNETFPNFYDCQDHEKRCGKVEIILRCDVCDKTETVDSNDIWLFSKENRYHKVNISGGYGSLLDGENVSFKICDQCVESIIDK